MHPSYIIRFAHFAGVACAGMALVPLRRPSSMTKGTVGGHSNAWLLAFVQCGRMRSEHGTARLALRLGAGVQGKHAQDFLH